MTARTYYATREEAALVDAVEAGASLRDGAVGAFWTLRSACRPQAWRAISTQAGGPSWSI